MMYSTKGEDQGTKRREQLDTKLDIRKLSQTVLFMACRQSSSDRGFLLPTGVFLTRRGAGERGRGPSWRFCPPGVKGTKSNPRMEGHEIVEILRLKIRRRSMKVSTSYPNSEKGTHISPESFCIRTKHFVQLEFLENDLYYVHTPPSRKSLCPNLPTTHHIHRPIVCLEDRNRPGRTPHAPFHMQRRTCQKKAPPSHLLTLLTQRLQIPHLPDRRPPLHQQPLMQTPPTFEIRRPSLKRYAIPSNSREMLIVEPAHCGFVGL